MVLAKNRPLFQVFILLNTGQGNVFYDIVERKNNFVTYKNKKSKKWDFSKEVIVHGFGQK